MSVSGAASLLTTPRLSTSGFFPRRVPSNVPSPKPIDWQPARWSAEAFTEFNRSFARATRCGPPAAIHGSIGMMNLGGRKWSRSASRAGQDSGVPGSASRDVNVKNFADLSRRRALPGWVKTFCTWNRRSSLTECRCGELYFAYSVIFIL